MSNQHWWVNYPWRMVQTNLRDIDMADIDAQRFASDLESFGATVVTLNAGGILANYDSKLSCQTVNPHLSGSSLSEILDACHEKGIRVIARMDFSKIPITLYEQHPDWAFRTADGGIIEQNGFVQTCQNGEYQQKKIMEILTELLSAYPFDGVFCNMSGFVATDYSGKVYGLCCCDNCRKGFRAAFGLDPPVDMDLKNPAVLSYLGFQMTSGKKLRAEMNLVIKTINPEIALDKIDYLRTESSTEIGEPVWVYSASTNSRKTAGGDRHMISDNAGVDFMGFRYRESSVSPAFAELRQWQNLANSGAVSMYIMGRLDNHRDHSSYAGIKKVFQFHKKHKDLLAGIHSAAEILLVSKSRQARSDAESYGWIRVLSASHLPFDEAVSTSLSAQLLNGKKLVILADVKDLSPKLAPLLDAYVENGGTLIASGDSGVQGNAQCLQCLGITKLFGKKQNLMSTVFSLAPEDEKVFTRCISTPVIAPGAVITKAEFLPSVEKYFHCLPEPKFGPPEVCYATLENADPALTVNRYGSGKGIFIPWCCGSFYHAEGYSNTLNFIQDVLFGICQMPDFAPQMHPSVELVLGKTESQTVVSLINASGYFGNSFFEPVTMNNIVLSLPGEYRGAAALNGGSVHLEFRNGDTIVSLDHLDYFEMIVLDA